MIETNIDDMSSEWLAYAEEKLFESGALDVYKTPIIMKKGRPAIKLSILVETVYKDKVREVLFKETTAIGMRVYPVEKFELQRTYEMLETRLGPVKIKNTYMNGHCINAKPEYEECKQLAIFNDLPLKEVYMEIERAKFKHMKGSTNDS